VKSLPARKFSACFRVIRYLVKDVESVVSLGDEIKVKVIGIDELGRINLSKKQVLLKKRKNNFKRYLQAQGEREKN